LIKICHTPYPRTLISQKQFILLVPLPHPSSWFSPLSSFLHDLFPYSTKRCGSLSRCNALVRLFFFFYPTSRRLRLPFLHCTSASLPLRTAQPYGAYQFFGIPTFPPDESPPGRRPSRPPFIFEGPRLHLVVLLSGLMGKVTFSLPPAIASLAVPSSLF